MIQVCVLILSVHSSVVLNFSTVINKTNNVILRRVGVTILAVEKQKILHVLSVCL